MGNRDQARGEYTQPLGLSCLHTESDTEVLRNQGHIDQRLRIAIRKYLATRSHDTGPRIHSITGNAATVPKGWEETPFASSSLGHDPLELFPRPTSWSFPTKRP